MRSAGLLVVACLALAACGGGEVGPPGPSPTSPTPPVSVVSPTATAVGTPPGSGAGSPAGGGATAGPTATAAPTATPRTTTGPAPARFVGAGWQGTAVYTTATAAKTTPVPIGPGGHGGVPNITVTGDLSTVFASTEETSCSARLLRAQPGQAQATEIGSGFFPAVAPDGSKLAYTTDVCALEEDLGLVVRDLTTGQEHTWTMPRPPGDDQTVLTSLAFDHQGARLVFAVRHVPHDPGSGQESTDIRVLDLSRHDSLDETPTLAPETSLKTWSSPTFRAPRGTVVVSQSCCGPREDQFEILEIDPDTGTVLASLLETDRPSRQLDFDPTGQHLLYVASRPHPDPGTPTGPDALFRWNPTDGSQLLQEGILTARW